MKFLTVDGIQSRKLMIFSKFPFIIQKIFLIIFTSIGPAFSGSVDWKSCHKGKKNLAHKNVIHFFKN